MSDLSGSSISTISTTKTVITPQARFSTMFANQQFQNTNIMANFTTLLNQTESLVKEYKTSSDTNYKNALKVIVDKKQVELRSLLDAHAAQFQPRIDALTLQ